MSTEMDNLETKVKAITAIKDKVVALLKSLADRVRGQAGDAAKATELAAELDASATAMTAAVTENTV